MLTDIQPVRVTPEAYYLFDTPAAGVPELCDAFKIRYVAKFLPFCLYTYHVSGSLGKNPCRMVVVLEVPQEARRRTVAARQAGHAAGAVVRFGAPHAGIRP